MNENPTDANEQFELGNKYRDGDGVPKDEKKKFYWYAKAAEQGHVQAQTLIGGAYVVGVVEADIPKDLEKAKYWYTKAAEQGNVKAQTILGEFYDLIGDTINAMHWYAKAAEQGDVNAQFNLGHGYSNGEGVPKDLQKAVYWYTEAAKQGNGKAKYNLHILDKENIGKGKTSSKNNLTIYSIIGAVLLGGISAAAIADFRGFVVGAIAGWFIGKKIGQKIKER